MLLCVLQLDVFCIQCESKSSPHPKLFAVFGQHTCLKLFAVVFDGIVDGFRQ